MGTQNSTDEILRRLAEQKFALDQSAIVAQTNAKGIIEYVNDKFCQISGYSQEELIGQSHRIINSGNHPKEFFNEMWKTISRGQIWRGEVCNRAKSGHLYWVATTIVPFSDSEGKPSQYLAIRQDITALKEAEQVVKDQQAQLIASSKLSAIGEMAATITHEINNPLGVILGRVEMLKSVLEKGSVDPEQIAKLAEAIEINGHRIEKIVKSMKSLSHQGDEDPFLKTSVASILQDLKDLFSERMRDNQVRLAIATAEPSWYIDCRSHEILQVLVNLINNSIDAIQELPQRWIRLDLEKQDEKLIFSVTDSGPGIAPELLEKIFMPFYSTKKVRFGTGLGLSISRSLIQRHHGDLRYIEQSPHTQFVITLPTRQPSF